MTVSKTLPQQKGPSDVLVSHSRSTINPGQQPYLHFALFACFSATKMNDPALQSAAHSNLESITCRLIAALGGIYTTSEQERLLRLYILQHIFTELKVDSLPTTTKTQGELWDTAEDLIDAFFGDGRADHLGWKVSDERVVREVLHGLMMRLLVLPAKRAQWRSEWTEVLRRAANDAEDGICGPELPFQPSRSPEPVENDLDSRPAGRLLGSGEKLDGTADEPKNVSTEIDEHSNRMALDELAKSLRAQDEIAKETLRWYTQDGASNSEERGDWAAMREGRSEQIINPSGGGDGDESEEVYSVQQASILTAIQEDNKRQTERKRAKQSRLAEEAAERQEYEASFLSAGESDEDFESGDEYDLDAASDDGGSARMRAGRDRECSMRMEAITDEPGLSSIESAVRRTSIRQDNADKPSTAKAQEARITQQGASLLKCEVCEQGFADADALNEHYREHFDE